MSPFSGNHQPPLDRGIDLASSVLYTWMSSGSGLKMSTTQTLSSQHRLYPIKVCPCIRSHMVAYTLLVVYRDRTVIVSNPTDFPDVVDTSTHVREVQEPIVKASIIVPEGLSAHMRTKPLNQTVHRIPWRNDGPLLRAQSGGCRPSLSRDLRGDLKPCHVDMCPASKRNCGGLF